MDQLVLRADRKLDVPSLGLTALPADGRIAGSHGAAIGAGEAEAAWWVSLLTASAAKCRASPGNPVGHAGEDGCSGLLPSGGERRAETCVARPCGIPSWLASSISPA